MSYSDWTVYLFFIGIGYIFGWVRSAQYYRKKWLG